MTQTDRLVARAVAEFGPSLLWNLRVPTGEVSAATARAVGRRLTREGGARAVRLGWDILDAMDGLDAGRLSAGGAGAPRGQPL